MEVTRDQLEIMKYEELRKAPYQLNIYHLAWERAVLDSVEFIEPHLNNALLYGAKEPLWKYAISKLDRQSMMAIEFGVYKGVSVNYMAQRTPDYTWHGFDSFVGLKEDWKGMIEAGRLSMQGNHPTVESNVRLIDGWFQDTLPGFLEEIDAVPDLIHIDSDTYESAHYILEEMASVIRPGALIILDEHHGYPNWRNGEFLALNQASEKFGIEFEYLAFAQEQALIKITKNDAFKAADSAE